MELLSFNQQDHSWFITSPFAAKKAEATPVSVREPSVNTVSKFEDDLLVYG